MSETPQQKLTAAVVIRNQWPLLTTLLGVFAGLAIVFAEHWRLGCTGIGAAMLWGGFWRAALGPKSGLLQVRG
ncbi:MAG: DUF3017 domain-containing protein, partial [Propionibacteriaceae bacterium]|nr:DUF3017 domain-containing protein [Propionibacteriaceae bacterium]